MRNPQDVSRAGLEGQSAKGRLLDLLLAAERKRRNETTSIARRPDAAQPAALSFAQERLWILDQIRQVEAVFNLPLVLKLEGQLSVVALERSVAGLIQRHEILRTHYQSIDGSPVQVVDPPAPFRLQIHDLTVLSDVEQQRQVTRLCEVEAQTRFDLSKGPMLRASLLKLSGSLHVLLLTMHHIASDGWSLSVINRELSILYREHSQGLPPSLPELPIQYADYAVWQRRSMRASVLQQQVEYWRKQLSGAPPQLQLPTDRPRPALETFAGALLKFELSSALVERLRELGRGEGATLFMVFLAAYQLLLSRWSGQEDVVVGSPIAGRTHAQTEGLIGFFVNMLPLRTDLSGNPTFRQLLKRIKEVTLGAYAHQDVPFDQLVMELRPERTLTHQPVFQVTLALQNFPKETLDLAGLSWSPVETELKGTRFDMTLHFAETAAGVQGLWQYCTDLYEQRTIERMIGQLRTLLQAAASDPERRVLDLPLMTDAERHRLLMQWNHAATAASVDEFVHASFAEQANRTPDAIALLQGDRRLTYRQLEERANQLAHALIASGIGPEARVAIYMQRSPEQVIALLGVLKAGGSYLPLDPSHPIERLSFILEDAGRPLLLTTAIAPTQLLERSRQVVSIDEQYLRTFPTTPPKVALTPRHAAYVIYTSGSTGQPKGVVIEHGGLLNYVHWALRAYAPESGEIVPISSPLAFDATATSLYCALLSGRTAELLIDGQELEQLARLLRGSKQLSLIKVSPAHLQALGPRLQLERPRCIVNTIVVGGEALPSATVDTWRSFWPNVRIVNQYGPTETVIACSAHEIPLDRAAGTSVPIGAAVANVQLYVVDGQLQPLPIGIPGELFVGGAQVSRGYLERPKLTAERYIANPFGPPGSRMYRTGDQVRYRAEGALDFIGRIDNQVKIRGYRLELGELESALMKHPAVKQAVVCAREDIPGEKRLVAYVVGDRNPASDNASELIHQLREYLKAQVPEYMMPSGWMVLAQLPLTPNGKVNRRALPAPQTRGEEMGEYLAPRDALEQTLADLWTQLLRVDRIGVEDNFFDLGGHSLLVLKALFGINQTLGSELKVADVYKSPTVRSLAELIRGGSVDDDFVDLAREATLDDRIVASPGARTEPAAAILVTGATGFVGRFIVAQLLRETHATLYCMVRAPSQQQAAPRLKQALAKWDLWTDECESRLVAVAGDLRLPRLGFDAATYSRLSETVDSIFHCATSMNHLETYALARTANVESARQLLQLATEHKPKLVNYVSTLGVFSSLAADPGRVVTEYASIDQEKHRNSGGYLASKWVGEKIFMQANERGIPCNIFRLGLIWADTEGGRYDDLQREHRFIKSCLLSGYGIENYRYETSPMPVDHAARAIVALSRRYPDGKGIFHLSSAERMSAGLFERCNEIAGTQLELLPMYAWVGEMKRLHAQGHSLPAVPLIESMFSMDEAAFNEYFERLSAARVRFDSSRTWSELAAEGIVAPAIDDAAIRRCVQDMFCRDQELRERHEQRNQELRSLRTAAQG